MKISIANILDRRKKLNIVLLAAVLCLSACLFSIATTKNPSNSKAASNPNPSYCDGTTDSAGAYYCTISNSLTLDSTFDNTNLTISGSSTTVITSGSHTFKNVTITNGATVTTEVLTETDASMTDEPTKLVDWIITEELTLTGNGKINVDGKGYWGGTHTSNPGMDGYGLGKGLGINDTNLTGCYGGGGGFGGNGQMGSAPGSGGIYVGVTADTTDRGSGGGHARCQGPVNGDGGNGGGIIKIHAHKITQLSGSAISANGGNGTSSLNGMAEGGGGAGGTIDIKTDIFSSGYTSGSAGPNVRGGDGIGDRNGQTKLTGVTSGVYFGGISATGGTGGGFNFNFSLILSGGGGIVRLDVATLKSVCYINSGTSIPASCENSDVIIDGNGVANSVVIATSGSHHYASMEIMNKAVLTHDPIQISEIDTTKLPTDPNYLNANGKNKKVDLVIAGDLILDGGSIDVSGKGYPGGRGAYENGYGPGGGHYKRLRYCGSVHSGGGGHGGRGGNGQTTGGIQNDSLPFPIDYGSGGGGGHCWEKGSFAYGGNGGGYIKIQAESIIFANNSSSILANGADGSGTGSSKGGGGAGGSIILQGVIVQSAILSGTEASNVGGNLGYNSRGDDGPAISGEFLNIHADGGSEPTYRYAGGGGGGIISINLQSTSMSIKKVLSPKERPAGTPNTNFNPYSIQKGDVIKVWLFGTMFSPGFSTRITDELFTSSDGTKCVPQDDGTWSDDPIDSNFTNNKIEWNKEAGLDGTLEIHYDCKVQ